MAETRVALHSNDPLIVRVEIPKGTRNKYEWNEELDAIVLDRLLFSSVSYPADYGFIPNTRAEDGDPLDALVIVSEATFPGCVIRARPVALFAMSDEGGPDQKVVCVPLSDPNWNTVESMDDIPQQTKNEIEHFFSIYKGPIGKHVQVEGWESKEQAIEIIEECRERERRRVEARNWV